MEDVNGGALAIECFLHLAAWRARSPIGSMDAFNSDLGTHQGELVNKEKYTKHFFEAAGKDCIHDLAKRSYLWGHLLAACSL